MSALGFTLLIFVAFPKMAGKWFAEARTAYEDKREELLSIQGGSHD